MSFSVKRLPAQIFLSSMVLAFCAGCSGNKNLEQRTSFGKGHSMMGQAEFEDEKIGTTKRISKKTGRERTLWPLIPAIPIITVAAPVYILLGGDFTEFI